MPSATTDRVAANTDRDVNRQIRAQAEARIAYYSEHTEAIADRLAELDREWDIERVLGANASALAFTGSVLAAGNRRWLLLPMVVGGFLFQHAMQGWCPPVPVLRRLGFRTAHEIEQERYALKALRGDFNLVHQALDKLAAALTAVGLRASASATMRNFNK